MGKNRQAMQMNRDDEETIFRATLGRTSKIRNSPMTVPRPDRTA